MKAYFKYFFKTTVGIILVIDITDKERLELVKEELNYLMIEEELKNAVLLVLANKQDSVGMSIPEI